MGIYTKLPHDLKEVDVIIAGGNFSHMNTGMVGIAG